MLSKEKTFFTKENLDVYLKELAKEFRKLNGKIMPAEIILVGGASVLVNYGFRDSTTDIDAIIHASSSMKDAISYVGDKFNLPNGWLNAEFMRTSSYSPKLNEFSVFYKTFSNLLTVRTISAEYLIAMKLRSGRKYKNDLSDIIGILAEHEKRGMPITLDMVEKAVYDLYSGWETVSDESKQFIENAINNGGFEQIFSSVKAEEAQSKNILIQFEKNYPKVVKESNINAILSMLKEKREK